MIAHCCLAMAMMRAAALDDAPILLMLSARCCRFLLMCADGDYMLRRCRDAYALCRLFDISSRAFALMPIFISPADVIYLYLFHLCQLSFSL